MSTCISWRRCRCRPGPTATTRRSGCSCSGRRGWRRTRRTTTSRPSPSCAAGSTGCPWRSSWVRRGRPRSASGSSPPRSPRELDLLAGGRRTAAARHRTLRAVVDASYRLLTPEEALLFDRLAVFPGVPVRAGADGVRGRAAARRAPSGRCWPGWPSSPWCRPVDGRFWLLETLRTYAPNGSPSRSCCGCAARHARAVADRVAELRWQQQPEAEPACVASCGDDRRPAPAWDHAAQHDRALAVELAAVIYDFAYQRQRLDLLDWGRQVAAWDIDHPSCPRPWPPAPPAPGRPATSRPPRRSRCAGSPPTTARRARAAPGRSQAGNLAMFAGEVRRGDRRFEECVAAEPRGGKAGRRAGVPRWLSARRRRTPDARPRRGSAWPTCCGGPDHGEPQRHRLGELRDR